MGVLAKPAPDREKQSVALVLTPSKNSSGDYDLVNQDSDLQQATTHFDFLKVNGHQIWISTLVLAWTFVHLHSFLDTAMISKKVSNVIKPQASSEAATFGFSCSVFKPPELNIWPCCCMC